jgi:hypothetical protein
VSGNASSYSLLIEHAGGWYLLRRSADGGLLLTRGTKNVSGSLDVSGWAGIILNDDMELRHLRRNDGAS